MTTRHLRLLVVLALTACAVNPATGRRELALIGEGREIAMGRDADGSVTASMGLVDDAELQAYVSELGTRLAAASERPQLPWTFKVVDDPIVNAFALPGGFIYVTRGILAHFESEAELVGVLGHEIGHVTGRHSVSQMSNQIALGTVLGVGMILDDRIASAGALLGAGSQLLSLKFSRSDESEADELGLRYMSRVNYDPSALIGVFQMLASVSGGGDHARIPEWQLTHPYPENREANISALIAASGSATGGTVNRDAYLDRLDGMIFGANPREGIFQDARFAHPEMAFELTFPSGWTGMNQRSAVAAVSPAEDAIIILQIADGTDARTALEAFLESEGITAGRVRDEENGEIRTSRATFTARTDNGELRGEAAVIDFDGQLFSLVGYAERSAWSGYSRSVASTISSFARLEDPELLSVQPRRLQIVRLREATTLRAYHEQTNSPVSVDELARINRVGPDDPLAAGLRIKSVRE